MSYGPCLLSLWLFLALFLTHIHTHTHTHGELAGWNRLGAHRRYSETLEAWCAVHELSSCVSTGRHTGGTMSDSSAAHTPTHTRTRSHITPTSTQSESSLIYTHTHRCVLVSYWRAVAHYLPCESSDQGIISVLFGWPLHKGWGPLVFCKQ